MSQRLRFEAKSNDGLHTLVGFVYLPDGTPCGYLHIVHGMTEHIARYDRFMTDMAKAGFICFGFDNLGHGKSVSNDSELGYIAKKNGYDILAKDVASFAEAVRDKYGRDIPYYLMGHSMGSFIVRLAAEKYVAPDKLIIMGTGAANPAAGIGLALAGLIKLFKGDKYKSKLIDSLAFGAYNKRFPEACENDPSPWLTNDKEVREIYYADKYCTFKFTVSAMGDLIRLTKYSNRSAWFKNISKKMPILLVSGAEDPVGNYGRGILKIEKKLRALGAKVSCRLYNGSRHEILNDFTYEETKKDILYFLNDNC